MKMLRIAAALIGLGLTATVAQAQGVDQRHASQQRRIVHGSQNGTVTPAEARRTEHQQRSIDRQESRMRFRTADI